MYRVPGCPGTRVPGPRDRLSAARVCQSRASAYPVPGYPETGKWPPRQPPLASTTRVTSPGSPA
eukprot:3574916-Rhodomonas_salina.1